MTTIKTDIAIIGGGLSGLALASKLTRESIDFQLFEARHRLGGRIASTAFEDARIDLGPTWFWPGQTHMETLVTDLGLRVFEQYSLGDAIYEDENGSVQRTSGFASMAGSMRIVGGMTALIEALASGIPQDRLHTGQRVKNIDRAAGLVETADHNIEARKVILSLPPRLIPKVNFAPSLSNDLINALTATPTWMAGQAKFLAIYNQPFWRNLGLSGDAFSRKGPLVEIHDASDPVSQTGALFGFVTSPNDPSINRADYMKWVEVAALDQLSHIFGEAAKTLIKTDLTDWAAEPMTATKEDLQPLFYHPRYGLPPQLPQLFGPRVVMSGTETAHEYGGYLEGALVSADEAFTKIMSEPKAGIEGEGKSYARQ